MKKKESFIVIRVSIAHGAPSVGAVLFDTFNEALEYARKDCNTYKHLANVINEKIGVNKRRARITMSGKYINTSYIINDLQYFEKHKVLKTHRSTYTSLDYLHDGTTV